MRKLILVLTLLFGMYIIPTTGNSGTDNCSYKQCSLTENVGQRIVNNAKQFLGCPYKWGAVGPKSFDCSGFVMWLYNNEGIHLSRTSKQQYYDGVAVNRKELQPGDLVFFSKTKSPKSIYHVGIVVEADSTGEYKFIHSTRGGVQITGSKKYDKKFLEARRITTV